MLFFALITLLLYRAQALVDQSRLVEFETHKTNYRRCLKFSCPSIETFSISCAIAQLCGRYTSKSRRPNGQHCYFFTDTALVCGVHDRWDGLYSVQTGPNILEHTTCEATGSPYETHCLAMLSYLGLSGDSDGEYGRQLEL